MQSGRAGRMAKVYDLSAEIKKILDDYEVEVTDDMKAAIKAAAKAGVKKVKSNAKIFDGTGKYKKGWTSRVEEQRMSAQGTIYNKDVPGLPHLLENGHAKRGGGRVAGREHIRPVQDEIEQDFMKELEARL